MEELNGNGKIKIEHRITTLEICQKNQDEKIDYVKTQVSNHLPTSIKALDDRMDTLEIKIGQMGIKIGLIVGLITFLAQKFIK